MSLDGHEAGGWALTINGFSTMELANPYATPQERIAHTLGRLDGKKLYALSISAYPRGLTFDKVNPKKGLQEYLQCAGSRDQLTLEVRAKDALGDFSQYVIGRRPPSGGHSDVRIVWDAHSTMVLPSEVFDADSALAVFDAYLAGRSVPANYALRRISA